MPEEREAIVGIPCRVPSVTMKPRWPVRVVRRQDGEPW